MLTKTLEETTEKLPEAELEKVLEKLDSDPKYQKRFDDDFAREFPDRS